MNFSHNLLKDEELTSEFKDLEDLALTITALNALRVASKDVSELNVSFTQKIIEQLNYNQAIKLYSLATYLTNSSFFLGMIQ